jgi:cobalt-zinc-cadmium efflux system outer membrane protein
VGGFVQQEFVTGGKLRLSRAKFAEEANAAHWQMEVQKHRVLNSVRIRYFDVVAAQRLLGLRHEMSNLNDEAARTTQDLKNVGQANDPDLLQAQVEARRARVALRNAESVYRAAWKTLAAYVGAPEMPAIQLDERALEVEGPPVNSEAILAEISRCSPEIQAAISEIRRDRIMVMRERVEPIPNVTVSGVAGYNYEFGLTTAGVQVSLPLPVFNRNQGTVREAMSDLARDQAEHERIVLSLRHRMADASSRYETARESVDDFREGSLPLSRRAFEAQMANFRGQRGARAAWPQVLVAQRNYLELMYEYVTSLQELRRAEVEIRGMLLFDGLAPPETPTSQGHIEAVPTPR